MDILFKNDHFVFSYRVGGILSLSDDSRLRCAQKASIYAGLRTLPKWLNCFCNIFATP